MKKWHCTALVLFIILMYQNFVPLVAIHELKANFLIVSTEERLAGPIYFLSQIFTQERRPRIHEGKRQGAGLQTQMVLTRDRAKSYISFAIDHTEDYEKRYAEQKRTHGLQNPNSPPLVINDRSEIRIVDSDTTFYKEDLIGQTSYSNFKFFIPSTSGNISNGKDNGSNSITKDWALIWQCAQHNGGAGGTPPLSFHIENDILSLVSFQNYNTSQRLRSQDPLVHLQRDRWYDVTIRYQLGERGSYAVWIDGKRIRHPPAIGSRLAASETKYLSIGYKNNQVSNACRVSFGLYKNSSPGRYEVLFQGINFNRTYNKIVYN